MMKILNSILGVCAAVTAAVALIEFKEDKEKAFFLLAFAYFLLRASVISEK